MKVALTIAGSDSSGGAGIQADLKTFEAFGLFGTSAITVLSAQNTMGVKDIKTIEPEFIKAQIEAVMEDFDVSVIKIGMLYSSHIIEAIEEILKTVNIPVVLDPVFISKAGSALLQEDAIEPLKKLFSYATLITPNKHEADKLFGYKMGDSDSLEILKSMQTPVLIKNEILHLQNELISVDQLYLSHKKLIFKTPYIDSKNTHGTGCSYSSAIAANLALGHSLERSIEIAKNFIYEAIKNAPSLGHGAGVINHKKGVLL